MDVPKGASKKDAHGLMKIKMPTMKSEEQKNKKRKSGDLLSPPLNTATNTISQRQQNGKGKKAKQHNLDEVELFEMSCFMMKHQDAWKAAEPQSNPVAKKGGS